MEKQEKYYALSFSDNFADEIDLTDIDCMSESDYKKWYNNIPYEVDPELFDDNLKQLFQELENEFEISKSLSEERRDLYRQRKYNLDEYFLERQKLNWENIKKIKTRIDNNYYELDPDKSWSGREKGFFDRGVIWPSLGNWSDGFEMSDQFGYILKRGDIEHRKTEVSKEFYEQFKELRWNRLGNINVFDTSY